MNARGAAVGLSLVMAACDPPAPEKVPAPATSASASIPPSPLASAPRGITGNPREADAGVAAVDEADPPVVTAEPMAPAEQLPADAIVEHDLAGVSLQANWRWRDVAAPPKSAEVSADGIAKAAKQETLAWQVDLTENGRMRIAFASRALPLPPSAELRARSDRLGNVLVWPNSVAYRVVPPGALRPLLGERRMDVTPLAPGTAKPVGEGKRLGVSFRRVEVTSAIGSVTLELANVPEAAAGGPLFCRALIEIAGVEPRSSVCRTGEVPIGAVYAWLEGGGVSLDVASLVRRTDLAAAEAMVPPSGATFAASGLPPVGDGLFLREDELAAFRTGPVTTSPSADAGAPSAGLVAVNRTDILGYLLLDGVPVVAVEPGREQQVIGPPRGHYVAQWRTFLGERIEAARLVELPARLVFGGPPAQAPDAGPPPKPSAAPPRK